VIPVARNVWQPIGAAIPAAVARRRIMRQASGWLMAWSDSVLPLCPRAVRKSQPLPSSAMPAAFDVGPQRFGEPVQLAAFLMQPDCPSGVARPESPRP
jgi:hypothetical protein